jgi:hypothetical protein
MFPPFVSGRVFQAVGPQPDGACDLDDKGCRHRAAAFPITASGPSWFPNGLG